MRTSYKRAFAQYVKKASKPLQLAIDVYKFRFNKQEYLMAYQFDPIPDDVKVTWIDFYQIGPHENFYTKLKRSIRLK